MMEESSSIYMIEERRKPEVLVGMLTLDEWIPIVSE
jgi:hypothetical protein